MIRKLSEIEEIDNELKEIDSLLSGGNSNNVSNNLSEIQSIDSELSEIDKELSGLGVFEPVTALETAGRAIKGPVVGTGSLLDLLLSAPSAAKDVYSGIQNSLSDANQENFTKNADEAFSRKPEQESIINEFESLSPGFRKLLEDKYHEITGFPKREKGQDVLGDVLETGSDILLTPGIPGTGIFRGAKAGNGALKSIGKNFAKDIPMSIGASTALNATPNFTEENTSGRAIEDLSKMILGSVAGSKAKSIVKSIKNSPAYLASLGSDINESIIKSAKEKGIELPFNVGMNSKPQNFLANNYLKSMFVSDAYKEVLKASDESMVNAVKKSIDTLGDSTLTPKPASDEYINFSKARGSELQKIASEMYEKAYSLANETDSVVPSNTSKFIASLKELFNRDVKSPATKKVTSIITELADSWGISPPKLEDIQNVSNDPVFVNKVLEAFEKNKGSIPIEKLIGVKKELGVITGYDPDLKGVENLLNGLSGAITKDIESSSNKLFVSELKNANKFFKQEIGDVFRTDLSRSILSGEAPVEAFNKMNSVDNIILLRKISGESKKGTEVFNSLAKAKVREIFVNSFNEGSLQTGNFSKIVLKNEKSWDILSELLGEKEFNNLVDLGKIASEYSKAGKDLLNTSGTAIASSDIAKLESMIKGIFGTVKDNLTSASSAAAGYAVGGGAGAVAGIAMPNLVSRLFSNPKFVSDMRDYAIARKANESVKAENILKRVLKLVNEAESGGRVERAYVTDQIKRKEDKEEGPNKKFGQKLVNN
ncbi:MAG: hypothetical protein ACRCSZ_09210 [Lactococcus lactis]